MALSTSSIQPGWLGRTTAWPSMRVDPAVELTISVASAIWSLDRNSHDESSNGAPESTVTFVSLLR